MKNYILKYCAIFIVLFSIYSSAACQTITDKHGRTISVDKPFHRIISLYSAHTENLFHIGASDRVIGVSVNDTYPPQTNRKQKFSYHDGIEKYLAAQPDLVLIRPMIDNGYSQFVKQLESYGITVVSLQPATVEEMYIYWEVLGQLCGKRQEAQSMVLSFKNRILEFKKKTQQISEPKKVYFQAIHKRMRTFTPGSMAIFALETAGGINVAEDAVSSRNTNVAVYSKEKLMAKAGLIDVIIAQKGIMNPVTIEDIQSEPGFHIIKAVKENQIFLIDESLVSRPVFRLLEGITAIGQVLYPELFTYLTVQEQKDQL